MARPIWFVELLKRGFTQRFRLARLSRLPGIGRLFDRLLFAGDDIIFLPRQRVIQVHQSVPVPEQTVLPAQVVHHFIDVAQYHWVMNFCICRAAAHCKDYPIELGCLFMGKPVLQINPRLGRLVTAAEAHAHVERCHQARLVHLIGRNRLDALWLGVHPGEELLTVCNCCPCCCLYRMLPMLAPHVSARFARMPGVAVEVSEACDACGACTDGVCFVGAISQRNGKAVISEACRGCGRCVELCPKGAIRLTVEHDALARSVAKVQAAVRL
ncbi:MAG: 4Fe-4S binding protein [bacterium]|jgi:Pyruvate/2-oxoacid:ferredoxin oxidoreductase delta subunit|nr:4Fe-4S binding protein [candidate division KSB1 bacterium]MDH7561509.1 4Fe-4S binding protein [bacterium]